MKTRILALLILALTFDTTAFAQNKSKRRIAFSPSRGTSEKNPVLRKLAPGLREVVNRQAVLVGKTLSGKVVMDDPSGNTGGLENVEATSDAADTVSQLIVSYAGKGRPTDLAIAQAGFNLVEDVAESEFLVVTPKALTAREQRVRRSSGVSHDELMGLASIPQIGNIEANYAMSIPEPEPADILSNDEIQLLATGDGQELQNLWGIRDTNAPQVQSTTNPREIIVAIIDTGVDYTHPDLRDNMWVNEIERDGQTGVDDDQNGVIDDVYGASFANGQVSGNPKDDQGHGTHCAGTVAGVANGSGVVGMAQTKIMALKFLGRNGSGSTSDAIKCINYARMMGAHVLSNSWGSAGNVSFTLTQAIDKARLDDMLFIAAAGNSNQNNDNIPNSPSNANVENVIAVGSINFADGRSRFSNYGVESVDIGAPGGTQSGNRSEDILSTHLNHRYAYLAGTSMATPHVSGAAALILGHPKFQGASYLTVKNAILENSRPNGALQSFWPKGRELDVSFLGSGGDGSGDRSGDGKPGNPPADPPPVASDGQFYHRNGKTYSSRQVLVSRTITLDGPAVVVFQASSTATMNRSPVTFATGINIGSKAQNSSIRLATTTERNHYIPFGTTLTTRLPKGTHRIEWWVNVHKNGSIIVRGGGSLDVQAFAVN